jgi:hypothetical protein
LNRDSHHLDTFLGSIDSADSRLCFDAFSGCLWSRRMVPTFRAMAAILTVLAAFVF